MFIYGLILMAIFVAFDQLSKIVILNVYGLGQIVEAWPGVFQLYGVYNTGAAFSMLNDHSWILLVISILATIGLTYLMKDFNFKRRPLYSIALVLIYSGTIGNMIDRMFNHYHVFDFIDVTFMNFAIFNVADSYLTIGVILMAVYLLFFDHKDPVSLKWEKKKKEETTDEQTSE